MDAGLQNANPTILSTAQLPSRRKQRGAAGAAGGGKRGPECKYDDILSLRRSGIPWVGGGAVSAWPSSDEEGGISSSDDGGESFTEEPIDAQEIYDLISTISDPEHPHTLGQLSVVNLPDIHISSPRGGDAWWDPDALTQVLVYVTPTINHCSLVTVIGLAIRVRLERALPPNFRVDIRVKEGSHAQDDQVTKQLADKERVAAALENGTLRDVLDKMLETCR